MEYGQFDWNAGARQMFHPFQRGQMVQPQAQGPQTSDPWAWRATQPPPAAPQGQGAFQMAGIPTSPGGQWDWRATMQPQTMTPAAPQRMRLLG